MTQPEVIVTLIHGTFAQNAKWIESGPLRAGLKAAFGSRVSFKPFKWSGYNTIWARLEGSRELAVHLEGIATNSPGARQIIIAHSHGGNIALYALDDVYDVQVAGVACLATPFLHASLRDPRLFDPKNLQAAFAAVWSLGLLIAYLFWFNLFEPLTALAGLVALSVGALFSACLGGYLAGGLQALRETASALADRVSCRPPASTNLFISRIVGDEASLALGTSQFFSWAASKSFARLLDKNERAAGRPFDLFTWRALPRPVWLLWWIALGTSIALIGWNAIAYHVEPAPSALAWPLLIPLTITFLIETTLLDRPLFGLVFLAQAGTTFLEAFAFGSIPPKEFQGKAVPVGRVLRRLGGLLLAMLVEVNAEVTPPGRWCVRQYPQADSQHQATSTALAHSAYDDPRVIDDLIHWIAASTGCAISNSNRCVATSIKVSEVVS